MREQHDLLHILRGLIGLSAGAALGYFAFFFVARQGFYALALPGALIGLGCGLASGIRSSPLATLCGIVALVLGIISEWQLRPFGADPSFTYFLTHLHQLTTVTLVMLVLGVVFAAWFGVGRDRLPRQGTTR